jgi:hypothetical protein
MVECIVVHVPEGLMHYNIEEICSAAPLLFCVLQVQLKHIISLLQIIVLL